MSQNTISNHIAALVTLTNLIALLSLLVSPSLAQELASTKLEKDIGAASTSSHSIEQMLRQLDSPKYLEREAATNSLYAHGQSALKPLASHYLKSSPEAAWRIVRVIESIATNGDEATFLKAVGLLQLLVGTNNQQLQSQLLRLKFEWATKQTTNAVEVLKSAGAEVLNYAERNNPQVIQNLINRQLARGNLTAKSLPPLAKNLTKAERAKKIDQIINGSLKDNRELVLGGKDLTPAQKSVDSKDVFAVLEQQIGNRIIIRNGNAIISSNSSKGIVAKFGPKWTGSKREFSELGNISTLAHVAFEKQYVDRAKLETLKKLGALKFLSSTNAVFPGLL